MNGLYYLALFTFLALSVWIASALDPLWGEPEGDEPWPTEADDREVRLKIEEQREADFYREDPDEMPYDREEDDGDD